MLSAVVRIRSQCDSQQCVRLPGRDGPGRIRKPEGSVRLTFKKAFGLEFVPAEAMFWLLELGSERYQVQAGKARATILAGRFGRDEHEGRVIDGYVTSVNRPFGRELLTLDVDLEVETGLLPCLVASSKQDEVDALVAPHIPTAFQAVRVFIERYRHCKYLQHRGTPRWSARETLVPRMTEQEFNTLLFYVLSSGEHTFVGSFSRGRLLTSEPYGTTFPNALRASLQQAKIPRGFYFIEAAWERYFDEDFTGAVLFSTLAVERTLSSVVRSELRTRDAGDESQIGKVVDDTSNRLLCTVVLGVLGIGTATLRNEVADLFRLRNELAHGLKLNTSSKEARRALETAESLLTVVEQHARASQFTDEG